MIFLPASDSQENTVFPLVGAPGSYLILKLQGAALNRGRSLFETKKNYSYESSKLCHCLFPNNKK